jgi:hypothetical protein
VGLWRIFKFQNIAETKEGKEDKRKRANGSWEIL